MSTPSRGSHRTRLPPLRPISQLSRPHLPLHTIQHPSPPMHRQHHPPNPQPNPPRKIIVSLFSLFSFISLAYTKNYLFPLLSDKNKTSERWHVTPTEFIASPYQYTPSKTFIKNTIMCQKCVKSHKNICQKCVKSHIFDTYSLMSKKKLLPLWPKYY